MTTSETPQEIKQVCKKCGAEVTFSHKDDIDIKHFNCPTCGDIPQKRVKTKKSDPVTSPCDSCLRYDECQQTLKNKERCGLYKTDVLSLFNSSQQVFFKCTVNNKVSEPQKREKCDVAEIAKEINVHPKDVWKLLITETFTPQRGCNEEEPLVLDHINFIEDPAMINRPVIVEVVISSTSLTYPVPKHVEADVERKNQEPVHVEAGRSKSSRQHETLESHSFLTHRT